MADKKVTGWFTMNGKHIPVFEGESKKDAVKRSISNGKAHQPVSKGHTEKKWKEFEDASRKAEIMHADIDAPKYRKKEIDKAREYDKAVEQKRKNGEIKSIKVTKKATAKDFDKYKSSKSTQKVTVEKKNPKSEYQLKDSVKKVIDDLDEKRLNDYAKNNEKNLKTLSEKIDKSTDSKEKAWLMEHKARFEAEQKYVSDKLAQSKRKKSTAEKNEDIKAKQIADAKKQAERASGKQSAKYEDQSDINTAVYNHMADVMFKLNMKYGDTDDGWERSARRAYEAFFNKSGVKTSSSIYNALGKIALEMKEAGVPSVKVKRAYENFLKRFYDEANRDDED